MSAAAPVAVTWHSFDLASGRRGVEVRVNGAPTLSRILSTATELEIGVRIWDDDQPWPGWDAATQPGRTMLVALDAVTEEPVFGTMVYRRRSDTGVWVTLNTITLEGYFDRRFVRDHSYALVDQALIAEGVIGDAVMNGVAFEVDAQAGGAPRDRVYYEDEDKTVLAVLAELAGVEDGIEFTVDLAWADDTHTVLNRIVRIGDRIGAASSTPAAVFSLPGSVTGFDYVEDYSAENGANAVQAVSSGEGDTRPESSWWVTQVSGWPRFERKFTPSTSITDTATLDTHARAELAQTWDGLNELTIEAHLDTAPRVGVDWHLGDDVAVSLTCPRFPATPDADGRLGPGYERIMRAVGWDLDLAARRIKPRLLDLVDVEQVAQ